LYHRLCSLTILLSILLETTKMPNSFSYFHFKSYIPASLFIILRGHGLLHSVIIWYVFCQWDGQQRLNCWWIFFCNNGKIVDWINLFLESCDPKVILFPERIFIRKFIWYVFKIINNWPKVLISCKSLSNNHIICSNIEHT
jgi:hypothetical protein